MSQYLPELISLARARCGVNQQGVQQILDSIDSWSGFLKDAEEYSFASQIWQLIQDLDLRVPSSVAISLRALMVRHRAVADARYEVMREVVGAFEAADIELVAIKGLALAPLLYEQDYLRPMRDVDVLVPKHKLPQAAKVVRELGFDLPEEQKTKYLRDSHQLPNATIKSNGFIISLEVHHNALPRYVATKLQYDQVENDLCKIRWRELSMTTLAHEQMLNQLCWHLAALHPGAVLKMINVFDVVRYAERFIDEIDWQRIEKEFSHVINTLRCLHYMLPLSEALQTRIGGVSNKPVKGVGESMISMRETLFSKSALRTKFNQLFLPPDWWLHLFYNVSPAKSLLRTKLITHPLTLAGWMLKRLYSRVMGG